MLTELYPLYFPYPSYTHKSKLSLVALSLSLYK
jgi:hypothetical protein